MSDLEDTVIGGCAELQADGEPCGDAVDMQCPGCGLALCLACAARHGAGCRRATCEKCGEAVPPSERWCFRCGPQRDVLDRERAARPLIDEFIAATKRLQAVKRQLFELGLADEVDRLEVLMELDVPEHRLRRASRRSHHEEG